jgi:tRNA(fMet)-specific endonuclease VapC
MICLDTNAVISLLNDANSPVLPRLERADEERRTVAISSIVMFELWYGARKSARSERNALRIERFTSGDIQILDFDSDDAAEAGDIRAALARRGTPIGAYDILIAAQARRRDAVLVTANTRGFGRVPGLRTEDWSSISTPDQ